MTEEKGKGGGRQLAALEKALCGWAAYWVCPFSILWLPQIRPAVRAVSPPSLWFLQPQSHAFTLWKQCPCKRTFYPSSSGRGSPGPKKT